MRFLLGPDTEINKSLRQVSNEGNIEIFASGEISKGTTARLVTFMKDNNLHGGVVIFNSPGGSLIEGVKLGTEIRRLGLNTAIGSLGPGGIRLSSGTCASSCAYAFAGGLYRFFYGKKDELLGIHQFYSSQNNNSADIGDIQKISSVIVSYLSQMGVDPQAFSIASSSRGDSMYWLSKDEAISLNLANNGMEETITEIKLLEETGSPYLKLEQRLNTGITRVMFSCNEHKISMLAGIVTNKERANAAYQSITKNYLELDGKTEFEAKNGNEGTFPMNDSLMLLRSQTSQDLQTLLRSNSLGIWTEDGGPYRWGSTISLSTSKEKMSKFFEICLTVK
jgi:hypothetical protein